MKGCVPGLGWSVPLQLPEAETAFWCGASGLNLVHP